MALSTPAYADVTIHLGSRHIGESGLNEINPGLGIERGGWIAGVCLHQTSNEGGGVRDVFQCGHIPKRELFNRICAYMDGLRDSKGAA